MIKKMSTQLLLKDAVRRGLTIDILDRPENIIRLSKADKSEYIKQATCASGAKLDKESSCVGLQMFWSDLARLQVAAF